MTNNDWDEANKADAEALAQIGNESKATPASGEAGMHEKEDWGPAFGASATDAASEPAAEPAAPAKAPTFKEAFAAARKASGKIFEWQGKKYTTALKSEAAAKKTAPATPAAPATSAAKSVMASQSAQPVSTSKVDNHGRVIKEVPRGPVSTPDKLADATLVNIPGKTGWFAGQKPAETTAARDPGAEVDFKVGKSVVASK